MTTLRLHKKIYQPAAVREAVDAFADFGTFDVATDGDYVVVEISDPDPDFADVLHLELANFALASAVEKVRS